MMAVELNDLDMMRQLVESVEPKQILMKVFKSHDENFKRRVINILGIDIQKVNPIYIHSHEPYIRKWAKNMFLFLDKEYRVMGFLMGSKWDSNWEYTEDYKKSMKKRWHRYSIDKTREALSSKAFHILMFEETQMGVKLSPSKNLRGVNLLKRERDLVINQIKSTMEDRLFDYRKKKYSHLNHTDVLFMVNQVLFSVII